MGSVSHSEVDSYLLCRRKHYYGYVRRLQRLRESDSLATGSAGHKVLEAFYRAILNASPDDPKAQKAAYGLALQTAFDTMKLIYAEGYTDPDNRAKLSDILFSEDVGYLTVQERYVKGGYTILAVEAEFNLEYDSETGGQYPFVVDLIVRSPTGDLVVVDHKFVYTFYSMEQSNLQPQIPKYVGALRALNYPIAYGEYSMHRTQLIKGTKRKDGTYPGPTLDQMYDFLPVKPNTTRVLRTFNEQIDVAREIEQVKALPLEEQDRKAYRTANKMVCQHCSFKDLCDTDLVGGNTSLLIRAEYKERERRSHIEVSEEA